MQSGLFPPTLVLIDILTKKHAESHTSFNAGSKPYEYFRKISFQSILKIDHISSFQEVLNHTSREGLSRRVANSYNICNWYRPLRLTTPKWKSLSFLS